MPPAASIARVSHTPRPVLAPLLLLLVPACATVDLDVPRAESRAFTDTEDTDLGRYASELEGGEPGESAVELVVDGVEALAARLILAESAERSIDAQYYFVHGDITGQVFLQGLLEAADRGVRVRLLVDDLYTKGLDEEMWVLDAHPNFELRVFNPFPSRSLRILRSAFDVGRVNRRMHNKCFVVDNQAAIVGGRNIGAEYFAAREDVNFGDLDMLAFGPVVGDVSEMFDAYWNDRRSLPASALVEEPHDSTSLEVGLRRDLEASLVEARTSRYAEALGKTMTELLGGEAQELTWAPCRLVYDPPEKATAGWREEERSILSPLVEAVESAESELLVISPYFVPRDRGSRFLEGLTERGVAVQVVTNSLAANNHALVHSGYGPSRKRLLRAGVDLREVKPDIHVSGTERAGFESSRATLHTKAFLVDRRELFIGSFNWDPRSARLNTEMGVFVESEELAAEVAQGLEEVLEDRTYRLALSEDGTLCWIDRRDGEEHVLHREPQTNVWQRLHVGLMQFLPLKGQL